MPGRLRTNPRGGFTLIELIVVVVVIGVLAAVVAPRYGQAADRYRSQGAAQRLVSDLNLAMTYARTTGTTLTITIDPNSSSYTITGLPDRAKNKPNTTVNMSESPFRTPMVGAVLPVSGSVKILPTGLPDSGFAITIISGSSVRSITFSAQHGECIVTSTPVVSPGAMAPLNADDFLYVDTPLTKFYSKAIDAAIAAGAGH